ncbi:WD repeat-containing protein slp1, partial [Linderina pennispora]
LEGEEYIASIKWSADGSYLAIGTSEGDVQIWDAESQTKIRTMSGHQARVGVMSWNKHIVSSGCRDGSIWNHDVRVSNHKVSELIAHESEVCGLTWRSDGNLLASGGNDNLVNVWDARSNVPRFSKTQHTAAVKALAWSPHETNLLATGGGSYDRHVHFWNTTTTARLNSIDTGSQVTSIQWSTEYKELVTSHGYPHNHLSIWSYPSLSKVVDIPAHDTRVLHTALSPDGQTLATTSSDESLKFWRLFETRGKTTRSRKGSPSYATAGSNVNANTSSLSMSRPSYIR